MDKGYTSQDILKQCRRLESAGIEYGFFYLAGISGRGKGEAGAKKTAEIFNKLRPFIVGPNMLTVYPQSRLYEEIKNRNWLPEDREKLLYQVNHIIDEVDEKELRYYRTHLRHL